MTETPKSLTITQVRSAIRRSKDQVDTLRGLGLTKLHRPRQVSDTPAIRGMIAKVAHLLDVKADSAE